MQYLCKYWMRVARWCSCLFFFFTLFLCHCPLPNVFFSIPPPPNSVPATYSNTNAWTLLFFSQHSFCFPFTGLRKVYPYYFTFTTFTKGRWVGEKILDVFAREFRAHPAEEYERCIKAGTLTVNYDKVPTDYRLKHNDLLANIVHR